MEFITESQSQTKPCPFCAETIQSAAIKCRFCGEFLNTDKAKALEADNNGNSQAGGHEKKAEKVLFRGRPSLWGMAGAVIKGIIFLGLAYFLITFPLEEMSIFQADEGLVSAEYEESVEGLAEYETAEDLPESELVENPSKESWFALTEGQALTFGTYRVAGGIGLAIIVLLVLLLKMVRLKMIYYEVTAERVEWSRGILDRRVDNLDMFRVIDLRLRRTLLDCIFGIGTVVLITTDKTDPEFVFEKIHKSRQLYDIIKRASLDADKRSGVIHLE